MPPPGRARTGRALVLTDPTLIVRRANERIVLQRERTCIASVPLRDIAHVSVHGPVTLTGAAIAGLLDAGIDVTLFSSAGHLRGTLSSASSGDVFALLAQVAAWNDPERRLAFARATVRGKIEGQRQLLQRHALDRGCDACRHAEAQLQTLVRRAADEPDLEALRGLEGAAAAHYFAAFGAMLSPPWTFEKRQRRPARDPVNALLNFSYALASGELVRAANLAGLDPRIGLLHGLRYGRESLALDLLEEFRPALIDRFVLRTLNRRQLVADDFETGDAGAVRLSTTGRKKLLERWDALLNERAARIREPVEPPRAPDEERPSWRVTRPEADVLSASAAARTARSTTSEATHDARPDDEPRITWRFRLERQVIRLKRWLLGRAADYRPLLRVR